MGVSIDTGCPRTEDPALSISRDRWHSLAIARRRWAELDLPYNLRVLQQVVADAPLLAEERGLASGDAFLADYLGLDLGFVRMVLAWIDHGASDDNPHRVHERIEESRRRARDRKRRQRGSDLSARLCACCGATFTPKRSDARCCSGACRAKLSRQAAKP
jgi:hypothetical protein